MNGTGFASGSVVNWNGSPRTTTFVNSSQLTAIISASDIAVAGTTSITVLNPTPGGGLSNVAYFEVTGAASTMSFATVTSGLIFPMSPSVPNPPPPNPLPPGPFFTTSIPAAVGDFNGDGKPDLAVYNGSVAILLSNGDGTFKAPKMFFQSGPVGGLVAGDFNGDGKLDLAVTTDTDTGFGSTSVTILLGNGDGTFQLSQSISLPTSSNPSGLIAGDFNRDGKLDLAVATYDSSGAAAVSALLGNGDGTFQTPVQYSYSDVGKKPLGLAAGDFNRDGKLDLAVTLPQVGSLIIYLANGDGTFQSPTLVGPFFAGDIAAADVNRDGKLDLISSCSVHLGNGDGTFQSASLPGGQYATTAIGDFNGDGNLDLACVQTPVSPSTAVNVSILFGNGDGSFQNAVIVPVNAPIFAAPATAAIVVADFNGDGKQDFALPGVSADVSTLLQGLIPSLTVSPNILQFPSQTGTPETSTLSNTGTATLSLSVSSIAISGTNATDFSQTNNCPSILAVNASCQVNVTFAPAPSDSGTLNATLSIPSNAPGTPQNIALTANDVPGSTLTISQTALIFAEQAPGTSSSPQVSTLTNAGASGIGISSIAIQGPSATDYTQTNTCASILAAGASCHISITFTPAAGVFVLQADVVIGGNFSGNPGFISLLGSSPPVVSLIVTPSTLSFPAQLVGTTGIPQTLTVTSGAPLVTIRSVTASPADFGVLNTCTGALMLNATCTIGVFFDPSASGTRTGTLTIMDDTGSPQTVALTGKGQDFSVVPSSASSATVTAGQTATFAIAVASGGGFAQSVTLSCSGGPTQSTCSVTPGTISLGSGAAKTATVTVMTTASGVVLPLGSDWPKDRAFRQLPLVVALMAILMLLLRVASKLLSRQKQRFRWASAFALAAVVCLGMTLASCGGGSGGGGNVNPQAGTYTITVTGNFTSGSANLTHVANLTLIVK